MPIVIMVICINPNAYLITIILSLLLHCKILHAGIIDGLDDLQLDGVPKLPNSWFQNSTILYS